MSNKTERLREKKKKEREEKKGQLHCSKGITHIVTMHEIYALIY